MLKQNEILNKNIEYTIKCEMNGKLYNIYAK